MSLAYTKMHGCGNDFIVIDGRDQLAEADLNRLAAILCDRRRGIGADGLIVLRKPGGTADFDMRYINATGMPGEMCGNGARCAARFAHDLGIVGAKAAFTTDAGLIAADIGVSEVTIAMPPPRDVRLNLKLAVGGRTATVHYAVVGVPHSVTVVDDLARHPVAVEGPLLRHHEAFAQGSNANFIALADGGIAVRTFERGVEAETLACGTGSVASLLICHLLGHAGTTATIITGGGDRLTAALQLDGGVVTGATLTGPATTVARGIVDAGYLADHGFARS
ncbi:MAG: diaminopimelate epimerase [Parvibaculaceae bacterium]